MPRGLNRTGDFRNGTPITLPHEFGTPINLPHDFGNDVNWTPSPEHFGNPVTWLPFPAHFGNAVSNQPTLAAPTFTPAAGTYNGTQSVTITSDAHSTATYYTTDGSTPTTGSTLYTVAISVAASETVKAISVGTGYNNSPVGSAAYVINAPLGPTLVASAIAQSASPYVGPATTSPINTTGANFIVCCVADYDSNSATITIADTVGGVPTGNVWTLGGPSTRYGFSNGGSFYFYMYAPTVGANHVFVCTVTGNACPCITVLAYSGLPGSGAPSGVAFGTGTSPFVIPTGLSANAGDLIVACCSGLNASLVASVNDGFTIEQTESVNPVGMACADLVAPSTAVYSPTWTWTGGDGSSKFSLIVFPG